MEIEKIASLVGHNAPIYCLAHGRDDRYFYTAGGDGWIVEWSLDAPELGRVVAEVGLPVFSLLFLKKEKTLVAGDQNGGLRFVPLDRPDEQRHVLHHKKGVFDIQLIENQLFTLDGDGCFTRWDLETWRPSETLRLSPKSLRCAVFLKKSNEIAIGASDGNVYFIDAGGLFLRRKMEGVHDPSVFCGLFLEEKNQLITGGRDARLKFWDIESDPVLLEKDLPAHLFTINHAVFLAGRSAGFEGFLVTASRDRTIKIWKKSSGELLKVIDLVRNGGHFRSVNRLLAMPDGHFISVGDDRQGIVWRVSGG